MALIAFRDALRTPVGLAEQGGLVSKLLGQNSLNETVVEQGPEMVAIPAGGFFMGSPEGEGGWLHKGSLLSLVINNTPGQIGGPKVGNERPQHRVTLCRPFALGRYAVTFDDYDAVRAATGRQKPGDRDWGRGRRPVINVSPPRRSGSTPAGRARPRPSTSVQP